MKFDTGSSGQSGKADYVKLKSGDSIRGVFRGEPHVFYSHWKDGRPYACEGRDICGKCAVGDKTSFRFKINFIVKENETYVTKVWEQGWTVFLDLKALNEGGYDLEKFLMKISRTGSTMNDTKYSVVPVPNGQLSPIQLGHLANVKLVSLSGKEEVINLDKVSNQGFEPVDETIPF